jgi:hypothetical protein
MKFYYENSRMRNPPFCFSLLIGYTCVVGRFGEIAVNAVDAPVIVAQN